jgi:hypothetical protein
VTFVSSVWNGDCNFLNMHVTVTKLQRATHICQTECVSLKKTIISDLNICKILAWWGLNIVTYRGFYSRWKFISVPKTQHTTVKCDQPFSKHTSGVYTQRCSTHDSFYRTSSGNPPTRTHILAVRKSPNTGARPASTFFGHKLSFLQSGRFQTHVLLSQFPNTISVFQPTGVRSQTHTHVYTRRFPDTDWLQITRSP